MAKDPNSILNVVYVCTGSSCKKAGGKDIYKHLKNEMRDEKLLRDNRIVRTKCTSNCKRAPIVTVMPANAWIHSRTPKQSVSAAMILLMHPPVASSERGITPEPQDVD